MDWRSIDLINSLITMVRLSRLGYKNVNKTVRILEHAREYIVKLQ